MKMFLGLTKPTSGSFTIDGKRYPDNRVEILKEVGSFIEAPAFYWNLSGEENLEIIRKILEIALFWMLSVCIQTPIFSVGMGLASVVPSVLVINTKAWIAYPMSNPFL